VNPNSTKKSFLNRLDIKMEDGVWRHIVGKDQVEENIIEQYVEHFSHAGATPLGYTELGRELGRELGHTGDTPMTEAILDDTFEHDAVSDVSLSAIVKQLQENPAVRQIIQPIVTEADF
jgi:hypothetical protein